MFMTCNIFDSNGALVAPEGYYREANGVLLSTFDAYHNVVKIRPPMVFSRENADLLVNSLDKVLSGLQ